MNEPTRYVAFEEINELQKTIMVFVDGWVRREKTPVPHKEILVEMGKQGVSAPTIVNALNALLYKGYIRRGVVGTGPLNRTCYVQLRNVRNL